MEDCALVARVAFGGTLQIAPGLPPQPDSPCGAAKQTFPDRLLT